MTFERNSPRQEECMMKPSSAAPERELNRGAYVRLKDAIDRTYPHGQFVAMHDDAVVADAVSFDELMIALRAKGKDPRHTLVVQAGVQYPETGVILIQSIMQ